MRLERAIDIAAAPERVWEVMVDVERWHEWTASVTRIELLGSGPFGLGSRVRMLQPKLRPATFEVTAFEPGRSFSWSTRNGGVAAVAGHEISPLPGGARVTLRLELSGWPLLLLGWWLRPLSTRYMALEAEGLKRRAEVSSK